MKVGDRVVWTEDANRKFKGIVIDSIGYHEKQNITIQWYEDEDDIQVVNVSFSVELHHKPRRRNIRYHISQIQDEKRIQIDKEYYRELKLNELGI
jgi:hypothetical protein